MKDLYKILNVKPEASLDEIKRAYFELAKKCHPDSGEQADLKLFYEVSEAYQILSNVNERKAYDLTVSEGRISGPLIEEVVRKSESNEKMPEIDLDRQREMHSFRRAVLWQAIFRVIGLSLLVACAGYLIALVLSGVGYVGAIAGFGFGLVWSANKNFNVDSFFKKGKKRFEFKVLEYLLMIFPLGYFVYLVISELF